MSPVRYHGACAPQCTTVKKPTSSGQKGPLQSLRIAWFNMKGTQAKEPMKQQTHTCVTSRYTRRKHVLKLHCTYFPFKMSYRLAEGKEGSLSFFFTLQINHFTTSSNVCHLNYIVQENLLWIDLDHHFSLKHTHKNKSHHLQCLFRYQSLESKK